MAKKKTYQVMITINDRVLFESTNSRKEVDGWLNQVEDAPTPIAVRVFKYDGETSYELVCEKAKIPKSEKRLIGFCR